MFKLKGFLLLFFILTSFSDIDKCKQSFRWGVKTCTDGYFNKNNIVVIDTTIEWLNSIKVPKINKNTSRIDLEKNIYRVKCKITKIIREKDGDYHLVLKSLDKRYQMVGEIPDTICDNVKKSLFYKNYKNCRPIRKNLDTNDVYYVTGVLFCDMKHPNKVTGESKNNVELHPIIKIE